MTTFGYIMAFLIALIFPRTVLAIVVGILAGWNGLFVVILAIVGFIFDCD